MKASKKKKLEANGWKIGSVSAFLKLSNQETAYLEMKLSLSRTLQEQRRRKGLTQHQLAQLLRSSQSRVAKMEAGDPSVSLDLLVRSLIAIGTPSKSLLRTLPH